MNCRSANCIAARIVLPGQAPRPGVLGTTTQNDLQNPMFRYGGMGVFGEWEDTDSFNIEFLSGVADTAEVVQVDFVQVRKGPA